MRKKERERETQVTQASSKRNGSNWNRMRYPAVVDRFRRSLSIRVGRRVASRHVTPRHATWRGRLSRNSKREKEADAGIARASFPPSELSRKPSSDANSKCVRARFHDDVLNCWKNPSASNSFSTCKKRKRRKNGKSTRSVLFTRSRDNSTHFLDSFR